MGLLTDKKSLGERARDGLNHGDWSSKKPSVFSKIIAIIVLEKLEANQRARKTTGGSGGLFDWVQLFRGNRPK